MEIKDIIKAKVLGTINAHDLDNPVLYHQEADLEWILTSMVEEIFHEIGREISSNYQQTKIHNPKE